MAALDQFRAQFLEVVDFTVELNGHRPVFVEDRLVTTLDVNETQPPESQRHVLVHVLTL